MLTVQDPDHGHHASRTPPEHALIVAILGRAILDLFGTAGGCANLDEASNARYEALKFLTDASGSRAMRRADLCDAIGFDGDVMRDRIVSVLEGGILSLDAFDARNTITTITQARELWQYEKGTPARQQAAREAQAHKVATRVAARNEKEPTIRISEHTIFETLHDGPKTIREIGFALGGVDYQIVRRHLDNLTDQGLTDRNAPYWKIKRPQSALEPAA